MEVFRRILVPTDFSATSNHALGLGVDLARQFNAELILAHFWGIPAYPYLAQGYPAADLSASLASAAEAHMKETLDKLHRVLPTARGICRIGMPWEEIMNTIEAEKIELVVMGTHARHGFNRLLLGSVAEKVVRSSPVPVLTVPPRVEES